MFKRTINYGVILLGVTSMPYLASSTSQINKLIANGKSKNGVASESSDSGRRRGIPAQPAGSVTSRESFDDLLDPKAGGEDVADAAFERRAAIVAQPAGMPESGGAPNERGQTPAIAVSSPSPAPSNVDNGAAAIAAAAIVKDAKEMPPVVDMALALRYDVTTNWILARYPRVTTGAIDGELHGYRVPLVTGTRHEDIAGSLTYYFNKRQRLEKITFRGNCGDPRKLVLHVTSRYNFTRQETDDPGLFLYQTRWNGNSRGELQIRPAKIVHATSPYAKYTVSLTMINPDR